MRALRAANRRRARGAAEPGTRQITFLLLHAHGMGGTIRTVFNLAGMLAADHDVEIVSVIKTNEDPFFEVPPGVRVTFLDDRVGRRDLPAWLARLGASRLIPREEAAYATFTLRTDLKILRFLRGLRGGVLITTRPGFNLAAALLTPPGVITIGQEHVGFASHQPDLQKLIVRRYGRLDALVTLTEADLKAYRKALRGRRRPHHLSRIPNAAVPFAGGPSPLTGKTVLAAGRLTKVKGFDLLIKAWEQVAAAHPGWTLRIVGAGPQLERLQAAIEERGLTGSVQLPGPSSDMGAEFDAASVLVLSSRHEGFPMTILEALGKGVPVVSFDCPHGPREILTDGHDGFLIRRRDIDGLAAAIGRLIEDEPLRRQMGTRALHTSRRYTPATIHAEWNALLAELSAAASTPTAPAP
ncbi:glycosyltransferase family 4 protein [Sphaerisporangium aureirubrum]